MKKINLEDMIAEFYNIGELSPLEIEVQKLCMKEACRQTLELAAENVSLTLYDYIDSEFKPHKLRKKHYSINDGNYVEIDKQSIIETINQIK